jgi:predicted dehydrogenase
MSEAMLSSRAAALPARPRLGFLGVGWIGRHRLSAIRDAGCAEIAAVADPVDSCAADAAGIAPGALRARDLDALLAMDLDGVVIATPSALHAEQSIRALSRGVAVFCQKPLGRTAPEVEAVVAAAREADRLLCVDLSYRFTDAMQRISALVRSGELGRIYAVDLTFHNAFGPDKPWFYDRSLSGGGCIMDLGIHLVDLSLWTLGFPHVERVASRLFCNGKPQREGSPAVEDYAIATLDLADGAVVRLACSWRLHAGRDACIGAAFYGTEGGAALHNVDGSFYDFLAERYRGTAHETLARPPDPWGGRAAAAWAFRLSRGERFDAEAERLVDVARVLDRIYHR